MNPKIWINDGQVHVSVNNYQRNPCNTRILRFILALFLDFGAIFKDFGAQKRLADHVAHTDQKNQAAANVCQPLRGTPPAREEGTNHQHKTQKSQTKGQNNPLSDLLELYGVEKGRSYPACLIVAGRIIPVNPFLC